MWWLSRATRTVSDVVAVAAVDVREDLAALGLAHAERLVEHVAQLVLGDEAFVALVEELRRHVTHSDAHSTATEQWLK